MRWTVRIGFLLFLAWIWFLISPFVALYSLSQAVEARDVSAISERVNFYALRISLSRQILGEYLKTDRGQQELGGIDPKFAASAGSVVLNPLIEQLVTPQALIDLLDDGWPEEVASRGRRQAAGEQVGLEIGSLEEAWNVFIRSKTQGFRSITIPFPATEDRERQFRITMRLSGLTWRVTGLDLPQALRTRLIRQATRTAG